MLVTLRCNLGLALDPSIYTIYVHNMIVNLVRFLTDVHNIDQ